VLLHGHPPEIDPNFLCHRLTMDERVKPMVQRRRKFNEDKRFVIREDTRKLLVASHVREIQYHEVAGKCCVGKESQREVENVCRIH